MDWQLDFTLVHAGFEPLLPESPVVQESKRHNLAE